MKKNSISPGWPKRLKMNLSRKIILASSVCAAFLAIGIGCTTEDRDVEFKGLFVCTKNSDCLEGSSCVGADVAKKIEGHCVRESEVEHCIDYDKDGFFTVTKKEYYNECGFTETKPQDPDDSDPMVYPGATEMCDGKDNSGDGCTDGECPEGEDCREDESKCKMLIAPCWGVGKVEDFENSACDAERIGVNACINGKLVYATWTKAGGPKEDNTGKKCPATVQELKAMNDLLNDGKTYNSEDNTANNFDDDCNGQIDELAKSCNAELSEMENKNCFVNESGLIKASDSLSQYNDYITACGGNESTCDCAGQMTCASDDSVPFCAKDGVLLNESVLGEKECFKNE